jgi:hypothetical protein
LNLNYDWKKRCGRYTTTGSGSLSGLRLIELGYFIPFRYSSAKIRIL